MTGNIDRISEGYFVIILDDGSEKLVSVCDYPELKVGQVVHIYDDDIVPDKEATDSLKEDIINLQNNLFS